jgi:hypothetical protein
MDYTVLFVSPDFSVPFMIYQSNFFTSFFGFKLCYDQVRFYTRHSGIYYLSPPLAVQNHTVSFASVSDDLSFRLFSIFKVQVASLGLHDKRYLFQNKLIIMR